ncbi:MAG: hypothetical protein KDK70_01445 [Myxococcales bacterium]|nr:hypothetical protein [Myxococcales bacterium]
METKDSLNLAAFALNERRAHEDPWHELATGGLTAEQVVGMRRHEEPDEQIQRKLTLFGPTSEDVSAQRLDALLQRFFDAKPGQSGSGNAVPSGQGSSSSDEISLVEGARRRQSRWWSTASITSVVMVAAAVLLMWLVDRPGPEPEMKMLPGFELQLDDGWSGQMRSLTDTDDQPRCDQRYHRDQVLNVRLSPDESLSEELSLAVLARSEASETRWLEQLSATQGEHGVIAIDQPLMELGLAPGVWTLTFYIVRKQQPLSSSILRALAPGTHPGVSVVRGSVCIVD